VVTATSFAITPDETLMRTATLLSLFNRYAVGVYMLKWICQFSADTYRITLIFMDFNKAKENTHPFLIYFT
jgi:hypothetical protein